MIVEMDNVTDLGKQISGVSFLTHQNVEHIHSDPDIVDYRVVMTGFQRSRSGKNGTTRKFSRGASTFLMVAFMTVPAR